MVKSDDGTITLETNTGRISQGKNRKKEVSRGDRGDAEGEIV